MIVAPAKLFVAELFGFLLNDISKWVFIPVTLFSILMYKYAARRMASSEYALLNTKFFNITRTLCYNYAKTCRNTYIYLVHVL